MSIDLDAKPTRRRHMTREEGKEMIDAITEEAETTADELADLAARGRAGFATIADDGPVLPEGWGEVVTPEERTIAVTAYGPDGESIVVEQAIPFYETKNGEVVDPPRAAGDWSAPVTIDRQRVMPGFEGAVMDAVFINVSGRVELNLFNPADKALWDALRWGARAHVQVDGVVMARAFKLALDKDQEDKTRTATASLKVFSIRAADAHNPYEEGESSEDETPCERCNEQLAADGLLCAGCISDLVEEEEKATTDAPYDLDAALADAGTEDGE